MNDFALFLGKFLRHGTKIASIAPSSRWLSQTTLRGIDWATAQVVVELGAGTGPITRALANAAPAHCRLLIMERDPDFCRLLRERFASDPRMEVLEADVAQLLPLLQDRGITLVDAVVSGLPVPSFPSALQRQLFADVARVLRPHGTYHQITEIPWLYQNLYKRHFHDVRFQFEPRNLPPAGAYICRNLKTPEAGDTERSAHGTTPGSD